MDSVSKECMFCGHSLRVTFDDIDGWVAYFECVGCDFRGPMSEFKYDDQDEAKADMLVRWDLAFARFQEATRLAVVEECAAIVRSVIEYNQVRASEARDHGVDWRHEALIIGVSERMLAAIRALQTKVAGQ